MPARPSLVRAGLLTVVVTASSLVFNLVTGVLIARVLGPSGRGAVTAALAAPPILSWLFEMGCGAAATYHHARNPQDGPRLVSTWLLMLAPLALVGVGVGEVLLPHLLAAQSAHTLLLARFLMLTVGLVFLGDLMTGIVLGDQDFVFYNATRIAQPVLLTLAYGTAWLLGAFSVTAAVATNAAVAAGITAVVTGRVLSRHGLGRPSRAIARSTLWYGIRAHSSFTAGLVNTRLDVLIIPAFVGASSVGLYSVATNVSWVVVTVAGSISSIVFPAAAARGRDGRHAVVKSLYATSLVACVVAAAIAALAAVGVRLIYGGAFAGSVAPLRVLLVGAVLYAAAATVCAGLYAVNRPFTAGMAQLAAAAVTVVGLLLFLRRGGILAAAIVSTIAYGIVLAIALVLYRRAAGLEWSEFVLTPSRMRVWAHQASKGALGRV